MPKSTKPYSYLHTSLLGWLADKPEERILSQNSGVRGQPMDFRFRYLKFLAERSEWFYSHLDTPSYPTMTDKTAASLEEFLNTRHLKFSVSSLQSDGLIDLPTGHDFHDKTKESPLKKRIAASIRSCQHSDKFYGITEKGVRWWNETGASQYREMLSNRFAQEAAEERTILIGKERSITARLTEQQAELFPKGIAIPLPSRKIVRPYATAVVVKEVDDGFFIRDIKLLSNQMRDGSGDFIHHPIAERRPHPFVARDAVLADHVNEHGINTVIAADAEIYQDVTDTQARVIDELIPILTRYLDLQNQQVFQQADRLKEALHIADNSASRAPGPKSRV